MSDDQPEAAAPAETLGGYEILKSLGADPRDGVFLARQQEGGRVVTLRQLALADRTDFAGLEVFLSKARNADRLHHPKLLALYDFLELGPGRTYAVLEPVHGETLQMRAARKPLLISEAVTVVAEVAQAIDALHTAGRFHGALDPSFVFLAEREGAATGAKVLDFGVMPGQHTLIPFTRLAPELAERGLCDARTDVWGLGALLFELLEGKTVHEARELSKETRVGEPVSFLLREVVETSLLAAPESRFKSAAAFRDSLLTVTLPSDSPRSFVEPVAPVAAPEEVVMKPPPSRLKWLLLALPVLALGLGAAIWALWPSPPPPPPPEPVVVAPPPEAPPPPALEPVGAHMLEGTIRMAVMSVPPGKKTKQPVTKIQLKPPKKHGR